MRGAANCGGGAACGIIKVKAVVAARLYGHKCSRVKGTVNSD